ncbi:MAG: ribonuclease HII [Eubacteriales bacterium]|nr:ribonuclease HII [Eubacteriales bacterium]NCC80757.1 ribonuclease HII [Clostridia bacterium]
MNKIKGKAEKLEAELLRVDQLYHFEREIKSQGYQIIAGTDEAGRGPIAGPVVAASVVLPEGLFLKDLNDSKKVSPGKREKLYDEIIEKCLCFGIKVIDNDEIDRINILQSSCLAMKLAIEGMDILPDFVLVDGLKNKLLTIPQLPLVKGDSKSASIAAASILAKVYRDRIMDEYDKLYPEYGFATHKGYPTKKHIQAVKDYGVLKIHRKTFTPISILL